MYKSLSKFGMRSLLFLLLALSICLAWLARIDRLGRRQLSAVETFAKNQIVAVEQSQVEKIQTFSFSDGSGGVLDVEMPVVRTLNTEGFGWLRRLLGETVFSRYSIVLISSQTKLSLHDINQNLEKLPYVERVYLEEGVLESEEIGEMKSKFPKIRFFVNGRSAVD